MDIPQNLSGPPNENMPYILSGCYGMERPALPVGQGVAGPALRWEIGDRREIWRAREPTSPFSQCCRSSCAGFDVRTARGLYRD
jgi:hypothetical protein